MQKKFQNGDPLKDSSPLIAWNCYCALDQGGLGLTNIYTLNCALLLTQCQNVASRASCLASIIHDKFLLDSLQPITYYKKSSVWLGLKKLWSLLLFNLQWIVRNGYLVRFWKDNWLGEELMKTYSFAPKIVDFLNDKVSIFISNIWGVKYSTQLLDFIPSCGASNFFSSTSGCFHC